MAQAREVSATGLGAGAPAGCYVACQLVLFIGLAIVAVCQLVRPVARQVANEPRLSSQGLRKRPIDGICDLHRLADLRKSGTC